jgi:hypothetical protein
MQVRKTSHRWGHLHELLQEPRKPTPTAHHRREYGPGFVATIPIVLNRPVDPVIQLVGFFSQWVGNGIISYYLARILSSVGKQSQEVSVDIVTEGALTKTHRTFRCHQLDATSRSQWRSSSLVSPADRLRNCSIYSRTRADVGTGSGPSVPRFSVRSLEGGLSG